jgi:hypothetical protein
MSSRWRDVIDLETKLRVFEASVRLGVGGEQYWRGYVIFDVLSATEGQRRLSEVKASFLFYSLLYGVLNTYSNSGTRI